MRKQKKPKMFLNMFQCANVSATVQQSYGLKVSLVSNGPWSCSTVDIISFDEKDSISNNLMWWIL